MTDKKKTITPGTAKRLLSYLKEYKIHLFVVLVAIFMNSYAGVNVSLFLKTLIDDFITPMLQNSNNYFSYLWQEVMKTAVIFALGIVAAYVYNKVMITVAQGVLKKIRDQMFAHMQSLPIKYFDTHTHGEVMNFYTNDTDSLRQMITQSIPNIISSVITIVAVFVSMLGLSVYLALFVVVFVVLMLRVIKKITVGSHRYFVSQMRSLAQMNGYIEEMVHGQKVVKVFCREEETKKEFDRKNEDLFTQSSNAHIYANILMPVANNMGYVLYVLVAIFGGLLAVLQMPNLSLVGTNIMTLGMIAAFLQLSRSFVMPIGQVSQQLSSVVMALSGAERIFAFLDEEREQDNGYVKLVNAKIDGPEIIESKKKTGIWAWKHPHGDSTISYTLLKGDIVMDDVDFGYEDDKMVLKNVSLHAHPGEKIAFVGATGAGKTTITNLLNRFYDIQDGKIRYDGININKIKKSDLRASLGIVLQDVNLFSGTILDNIRYGRPDATDEECIDAAKLVNADGFIKMLPDGYNTVIDSNESGLSQGQRQLISIARAAVLDPPVMILDEATSCVDTRTEEVVQKGMDALMKGRTVFVIAHRLSTIKNADVIMVLEKGRIKERGTHEELLKQNGLYYQLYTGAFELE